MLPDFEQRFPAGAPSLRRCRRFKVEGDVTLGAGVVAVGDVRVVGPGHVRDGGCSADETGTPIGNRTINMLFTRAPAT